MNNNGLSTDEVKESRRKYGNNSICGKNENTFWSLFLESLGDPIIKILLIALGIKTIFLFKDFDYFETIGIVMAILVASLISALSEYGSSKAFQRMQEESSKINVKVRRDGHITEIPIDEVVVSDIVLLTSGDRIPCDGIITKGKLSIDESSLNGEAKEVYKEEVKGEITSQNRVYRGTTIYDGDAEVLTLKVGMDTLYGKMAKELTEEEDTSPLKLRLQNLAKTISTIGYVAAILIAISYLFSKIFIMNNFDFNLISQNITLNIFLGYILEAMTLAVSVLVMSVPEGLPMMITLVLSTNAKKMLKDNVLVRKMVGLETAGSLNILFTDKTGTITKGKMEVCEGVTGDLVSFAKKEELSSNYLTFLTDAILYNNDCEYDIENNKIIGGNMTDKALFAFADKKRSSSINLVDKIPFNSQNKYSISIIEKDKKKIKLIKGSYDKIINYSSKYLTSNGYEKDLDKDRLLEYIEEKTKKGLRALAISYSKSVYPTESYRRNTLIAVLFIKDDIRREASLGVDLIKKAGVNIVMVTGDSKSTATSIAKEAGIVSSKDDIILTSTDLSQMSDSQIESILPSLKVVARAMPEDKKRLVTIARGKNLVTGMTGDGVNDSIALKKADVSFAMGSGTEVAKEASDIVIMDDNILSIAKAILYGRVIFKNIRKFIIFQLTVNIAAVSLALIGPFIGIPTPITVIQMLWINMVMDTLAGLAFSYEIPRKEYMEEKPKKKDENIINNYMLNEIILSGIYYLFITLIFLKLPLIKTFYTDNNHFMTAFFTLFIFLAVFNSFNSRTERINIFAHLKENKVFIFIIIFIIFVQILLIYSNFTIFDTVPINFQEFLIVILLAISIIPFDLLRKIIFKKRNNNFSV